MSKTITRADLAESVYEQVGLSRNESSDLVEVVLDEIMTALIAGDNVKLSSFGSFSVREKGERIGRNPKTGTRVEVPSKRIPYFKPSKELKDLVNASANAAEAAVPPAGTPPPAPPAGENPPAA